MFEVVGDDVFYEGYLVATLRGGVPATVRQKVIDDINEAAELRDMESADCEDCKSLAHEVAELEDKLDDAIAKRDAYAAMLGVPA